MPGKVNPVAAEVANQASFLAIGLDTTVMLAASCRPARTERYGTGYHIRFVHTDEGYGQRLRYIAY